jgi:hemin uptake protein HemP
VRAGETHMTESADAEPEKGALKTARVRIASSDLFHGRREVVIVHRGTEYRLHITKADKLILTK